MKRFVSVIALLLCTSPAFATTWDLDAAHSSVGFSVKHMMVSNVKGSFDKFSGSLDWNDKDPTKSTVMANIDMKSVNTNMPKRDDDLRGADFFDVEKFPEMTFKSTKVKKAKSGYTVTGDLTMHGVTKAVELTVDGPTKPVKDPWGNTRIGVSISGKLNRKDFGLTYNKALEAGGLVVGEEISITIEGEFTQKAEAPKT